MLKVRVIPTLLLRNQGIVKGSKFKDHSYVGDPVNAVKIFNDKEVDELVFLDITASNENKKPNLELLRDIASQAFMPFGYGGGVNTLEDIEQLFKIGVEKVIINTEACKNLDFITKASKLAGSSSIVVSVDVKKNLFGQYQVFSNSGTVKTKLKLEEYLVEIEKAGAGEILLCSIDREGTRTGLDLNLIESISNKVSVPLVVAGGSHSLENFKEAVDRGACAVAVGDMFVFYGKHRAVLITYPEYHELEILFKD